jgi:hypothetical protein
MDSNSTDYKKHKIIRRLINYSSVYFKDELELKSIEELQKIQDLALIKLILKTEYQKRKNNSIKSDLLKNH